MKIGVNIQALREARIRAFFTQAELAKRARCHHSTVSLIESGARLPSQTTAGKLAAALGKEFDDLFYIAGDNANV